LSYTPRSELQTLLDPSPTVNAESIFLFS